MNGQEILSLIIVVLAVVQIIRFQIQALKTKKDCGNCALAEAKNKIRYIPKK